MTLLCARCGRKLQQAASYSNQLPYGPSCARRLNLTTSKRRMASHVDDATPDLFASEKPAAPEVVTARAAP